MGELRVLTYNVRSLRAGRRRVAAVIRACAPDLVAVQEAPRALRWRSRCAALARECGLVSLAGGRTGGGNLLLAAVRVDVDRVVERRLRRRVGQPLRGVVAATVRVGGAPIGIVGMHLGLSAAERREQTALVTATARELGTPLVLLAGDLNEPTGGPSWRAFATAGFCDPVGDGHLTTFPARDPRARIDAILVSAGARVREYRVPGAELTGEQPPGEQPPGEQPSGVQGADPARASDHRPVLAVLDLPI